MAKSWFKALDFLLAQQQPVRTVKHHPMEQGCLKQGKVLVVPVWWGCWSWEKGAGCGGTSLEKSQCHQGSPEGSNAQWFLAKACNWVHVMASTSLKYLSARNLQRDFSCRNCKNLV